MAALMATWAGGPRAPEAGAAAVAGDARVYAEPGAGAGPLLGAIAGARRTLDGEIYLLTDRRVEGALGDAARRGVRVRLILEHHPYGVAPGVQEAAYRILAGAGAAVHWGGPGFAYAHAKYLVADRAVAWIGSMNWTAAGLGGGDRDFGVADRDPGVAADAEGVFAGDWAGGAGPPAGGRVVASPGGARAALASLIAGARRTLDVYAEEVRDPGQEALLTAAAGRRVRVRIVSGGDGDLGTLRAGGVAVAVVRVPYIHAKAMVADGILTFVGSQNISPTSLDRNRELGIILRGPAAAAAVEAAFGADFARGEGGTLPGPGTPPTAGGAGAGGGLPLSLRVSPDPATDGEPATLTATTAPGAACRARVMYASGAAARSAALQDPRTADAAGRAAWTWTPGTSRPGPATATATCALGNRTATATTGFAVR